MDDKALISWLGVDDFGLRVDPANSYVDPQRPVAQAIISHGHADHARAGHGTVWATPQTVEIMQLRYGQTAAQQFIAVDYDQPFAIGGVLFRFMPAGHVLGSAQVVMEHGGVRAAYSGDFKRRPDPTCLPFVSVPCDVWITEATFGLPIFRHPCASTEAARLVESLRSQPQRPHLVGVYGLGKCQRLIAELRGIGYPDPIFLHSALRPLCGYYESQGVALGPLLAAAPARAKASESAATTPHAGGLVLAPPSALRAEWSRQFVDPVIGMASGWMTVRQRARVANVELPLRISDHADWPELMSTIVETGCREVWVTHGHEDALIHACTQRGIAARALALTGFEEGGD